MSLADSQYDVKIGGNGFVLMEESYRKKAQPAFWPRFSTGSYSLTDLSFWQFIAQESFAGGSGQIDFQNVTQFRESVGWSIINGKPQLAGGNESVTLDVAATAPPTTVGSNEGWIHQMVRFFRNATYPSSVSLALIAPKASPLTFNGTKTQLLNGTTNKPSIWQVWSYVATVWERSLSGIADHSNVLAVGNIDSIDFVYDNGSVAANLGSLGCHPACIIPLNNTQFVYIGKSTSYPQRLLVARDNFDTQWTAGTAAVALYADLDGHVLPSYAIDASSTVYFATVNVAVPGGSGSLNSDNTGSTVCLMTTSDVLASDGPRISQRVYFPDFIISSINIINGSVYIIGAHIEQVSSVSGQTVLRNQVLLFPGTVIWQSETTFNDGNLDQIIRAVCQFKQDQVLFLNQSSLGQYVSVMKLTSNNAVFELGCLPLGSNPSYYTALNYVGGSIYAYNAKDNAFTRARLFSSLARNDTTKSCILRTSNIGANTPLITKSLYSITIELSTALTGSDVLTISCNGVTLGTITSSDILATPDGGIYKEIFVPSEITSTAFSIKIIAAGTVTWPGYINRITTRFIPTQFKKFAWGFGVRATNKIKRSDGTWETLFGKDLMANLITSWQSNIPITFIDVDGVSYQVIITDFDQRRPLLDRRGGNNTEAFMFLELLQV